MTETESPKMFIHGNGGIAGYRGRVVYRGRTEWVLLHGQWAFDTREQAVKATKRYARIWAECEARRPVA